jgi:hypothetical protein
MKRPLSLSILMWFSALYAVGAILGITAVVLDLGRFVGSYSMGGMPVSREKWLTTAAPLVAIISILMGATALGLKRHRPWARKPFMCIWPIIIVFGIGSAVAGAVPWSLGIRAVIDASFVGGIAAWLLFGSKASRAYFDYLRASARE